MFGYKGNTMNNISLQVNIEGHTRKVVTDWDAIASTLRQRNMSTQQLATLYADLCAGLRVTTRGLTLAKINPGAELNNLIRAPKREEHLYVGESA